MTEGWIERRALRILQNDDTPLYLFALAAEEVDLVADVARISRDEAGKLIGYQRPEKRKHVKQIQDYLDSADVLFPNGLILALPPEVKFKSSRGPATSDGLAVSGTLEIPLAQGAGGSRPAWIVDGQQRSLALARTKNKRLPVPVAGFVAPTLELQREQFLRVNTVQPLPANLVTELLPEIARVPSARMSARQLPSALVDMLNLDPESPFFGLIKRASTPTDDKKTAVVTDTGLVEAMKESLESPSGVLFPYRNIAAGTTDTAGIRDGPPHLLDGGQEHLPGRVGAAPDEVATHGWCRDSRHGTTHGARDGARRRHGPQRRQSRQRTNCSTSRPTAAGRMARGPNSACRGTNCRTPRVTSARLSNFLARTYVTNRMAAGEVLLSRQSGSRQPDVRLRTRRVLTPPRAPDATTCMPTKCSTSSPTTACWSASPSSTDRSRARASTRAHSVLASIDSACSGSFDSRRTSPPWATTGRSTTRRSRSAGHRRRDPRLLRRLWFRRWGQRRPHHLWLRA